MLGQESPSLISTTCKALLVYTVLYKVLKIRDGHEPENVGREDQTKN